MKSHTTGRSRKFLPCFYTAVAAPCSSYCLETLSEDFAITVFYYNPNIYPEEEYWKRVREQERFIGLRLRNIKSLFWKATMKKNGFMRQ